MSDLTLGVPMCSCEASLRSKAQHLTHAHTHAHTNTHARTHTHPLSRIHINAVCVEVYILGVLLVCRVVRVCCFAEYCLFYRAFLQKETYEFKDPTIHIRVLLVFRVVRVSEERVKLEFGVGCRVHIGVCILCVLLMFSSFWIRRSGFGVKSQVGFLC